MMRRIVGYLQTAFLLAAALLTSGCFSCRVPGKGKAEGGKYRECAKMGRSGQGEVTVGEVKCSWDDDRATCSPEPGESLDLCVMAGTAGGGATRKNISAFLETCSAGGVDMIVVLGDVGSDTDSIRTVLEQVGKAEVVVGVLPGSTEPYKEYLDAVDEAQVAELPIIDLSRVRVLSWGKTTLVTMPGIRNPYHLAHEAEGCGYDDGDVEKLGKLIEDVEGTVVMLGVQPPRCDGGVGVDSTREGIHVGDPALATMLRDAGVTMGVFGHIYEAGGLGVDPVEGTLLYEGTGYEAIWINIGSIEAAPWGDDGPGIFSTGQGVVVQVADGAARYFVWKSKKGEDS